MAGSPSGSWTSATTDWVATWNPAAPDLREREHGQPAPAVRGPSGGGTAARTPRASAMPSTSVGARSSASHSKRCGESPAGRRPSLSRPPALRLPPVAISWPDAGARDRDPALERRRGEVGEGPRRRVVGIAARAAEREHAMRDGVVDERVDVDRAAEQPHPRAEPDEPPAADLGLGRRARAAGEQRGHGAGAQRVDAQHGLAHELRDPQRVERRVRAGVRARPGRRARRTRPPPTRAPRSGNALPRSEERRGRPRCPRNRPLRAARGRPRPRAERGPRGWPRRAAVRPRRAGGRPGPTSSPSGRARKAWTAGTTCSHGGWSAQSQRA